MEEIRKEKVREAIEATTLIYDRLGLNLTEIEVVTRSENITAKTMMAEKELKTEAETALEKKQTPIKIKIIKWIPTISSVLAIIFSLSALLK